MNQKIILISADALVGEDLEYLSVLPNFQRWLAGGASVKKLKSCYPTVTYPAHSSIMTGVWPDRHGVISNYFFDPSQIKHPWRWYSESVAAPDIFGCAHDAKKTTSAVFWPCTGNNPGIDYLIDECWAFGEGDTSRDAFLRTGSSPEVMSIIDRHISGLVDRKHPEADTFAVKCACDLIREFSPDLMMIHPANIDSYRHSTGLFTEKVRTGVKETDEWLGMIMHAVADTGYADRTNIILMSDHGQLEIKRVINLNVLFADCGLIRLTSDGRVADCKAFIHSNGMSAVCRVYDRSEYDRVRDILYHLRDEGIYGVSEVFTEEESRRKYRFGGEFDFVIETDGYTSFADGVTRPIVSGYDSSDYRRGHATHGYLPEKGPQPVFIAKGPAFRKGAVAETAELVDIAPMLAAILGLDFRDCDGRIPEELLV